jgi:hypothetical protein
MLDDQISDADITESQGVSWILAVAYVFIQAAFFDKALILLKGLDKLNTQDPQRLKLLAYVFYKKEEYKAALTYLQEWLENAKDATADELAQMYLLQAKILHRLNQKKLAKQSLIKSAEIRLKNIDR